SKSRGSLDLTRRETLLAGGDQGPAVVAGQAGKSLLVAQVTGAKPAMPRNGTPLTPQEIADLRAWIDAGAPWPKGVVLAAGKDDRPRVDAEWWSLRPLQRPALPMVRDAAWCRTPVDRFILATLETRGLRPS